MDSKRQIMVRGVSGVLWWRFWNPMAMMGGEWDYWEEAVDESGWNEVFDGRPLEMLWTQNHTEFGLNAIVAAKKAFDCRIVTDIDDWYDAVPDYNPAIVQLKGMGLLEQVKRMHEQADTICCSTPFLVDKMGSRARLCQNFIVPESWNRPSRKKPDGECLIVMAGGAGRSEEFAQVKDAVIEALKEPNVKVLCLGRFHEWLTEFPPGKVIWGRWAEAHDYPKVLQWIDPDIVISPLEHNEFNLAKSNIKWLESAMVGAAFLGERWGELERTVVEGQTGFLASGIEEWTEKLVALARDKAMRDRASGKAAEVVNSDWTWGAMEQNWRGALEG